MEVVEIILKLVVGLSILNVWLLRANKPTRWRGGDAQNIFQEFKNYGLPLWFTFFVGGAKVILSLLLLISIFVPGLEKVAAYGIALFMAGAVSMHFRINDPVKKAMPAFTFLILALLIAFI